MNVYLDFSSAAPRCCSPGALLANIIALDEEEEEPLAIEINVRI
jgi:hypothetical protein